MEIKALVDNAGRSKRSYNLLLNSFIKRLEEMDLPENQNELAIYQKKMEGSLPVFTLLGLPCSSGFGNRGVKIGPKARKEFLAHAKDYDLYLGQFSMVITVILPRPYIFNESQKERKKRRQSMEAKGESFLDPCKVVFLDNKKRRIDTVIWDMSFQAANNLDFALVPILEKELWAYYKNLGGKKGGANSGPSQLVYPANAYVPPPKKVPGEGKAKLKKYIPNGFLRGQGYDLHKDQACLMREIHWELSLDGEWLFANSADYLDNPYPFAELWSLLDKKRVVQIDSKGFVCPPKQVARLDDLLGKPHELLDPGILREKVGHVHS